MSMTTEHKEALARGRNQSRVVRRYLDSLSDKRRGRPVDRQSLEAKIGRLQSRISEEANVTRSVELVQQRLDLEERLAGLKDSENGDSVEQDFVSIAGDYSQQRGISYEAWREAGVPAAVLRQAGVSRGSSN